MKHDQCAWKCLKLKKIKLIVRDERQDLAARKKTEISLLLVLVLTELIIEHGDEPVFCSFVGDTSLWKRKK